MTAEYVFETNGPMPPSFGIGNGAEAERILGVDLSEIRDAVNEINSYPTVTRNTPGLPEEERRKVGSNIAAVNQGIFLFASVSPVIILAIFLALPSLREKTLHNTVSIVGLPVMFVLNVLLYVFYYHRLLARITYAPKVRAMVAVVNRKQTRVKYEMRYKNRGRNATFELFAVPTARNYGAINNDESEPAYTPSDPYTDSKPENAPAYTPQPTYNAAPNVSTSATLTYNPPRSIACEPTGGGVGGQSESDTTRLLL